MRNRQRRLFSTTQSVDDRLAAIVGIVKWHCAHIVHTEDDDAVASDSDKLDDIHTISAKANTI